MLNSLIITKSYLKSLVMGVFISFKDESMILMDWIISFN